MADCDGSDECYTSCNNEKCDVYEKTILLNPHLNENLDGWYCRGGCIMAEIDEGYDQAQASKDEDGRLRTVHPSIRPCDQRSKIWARTVHLTDEFGRP